MQIISKNLISESEYYYEFPLDNGGTGYASREVVVNTFVKCDRKWVGGDRNEYKLSMDANTVSSWRNPDAGCLNAGYVVAIESTNQTGEIFRQVWYNIYIREYTGGDRHEGNLLEYSVHMDTDLNMICFCCDQEIERLLSLDLNYEYEPERILFSRMPKAAQSQFKHMFYLASKPIGNISFDAVSTLADAQKINELWLNGRTHTPYPMSCS
jgi:hypothetical protein